MTRRADHDRQADSLLANLEELEATLQELREGLTRSHRLATLGTMASIIAHEFNNILTPMISYCQLALANPDDEALMRKALQRSLRGAERAAQISDSMLGFARPGDENTPGRCCVRQVIDEAFNCLVRPPEKNGLSVKVEVPDSCEADISPLALQQVLVNLIINATRAMERNRGHLSVRAEQAGERVIIRIGDTGSGIDPAILSGIFEPFVTHRSREVDDLKDGTGLGLAICRQLVEAAGGTIDVEATSSEGTTFRIDLPAADTSNASGPTDV